LGNTADTATYIHLLFIIHDNGGFDGWMDGWIDRSDGGRRMRNRRRRRRRDG